MELRTASLAQEVKLAEETARETKDGPLAREKHEPREQPSASSRGRMSSMALRATEEKAEMAAAQKRRNKEEVGQAEKKQWRLKKGQEVEEPDQELRDAAASTSPFKACLGFA